MKRILAISLTLVMLLVALTGCMSPQNPSGKEGEQNHTGSRKVIDIIPEIYISHLSVKAEVMVGEERWQAACTEEGVCLQNMVDMHAIIADCYEEKGEFQKAIEQCETSLKLLELLKCGSNWDPVRNNFKEKAEKIKAKIK